MKTTEGERVAGILDLLKEVSQDKRIKNRVYIKVLIGHPGGMDPEMAIVFHGPYFQEKFEVELTFWPGTDEYELTLITSVSDLVALDIGDHKVHNLTQTGDIKPHFENIMRLYE